MFHKSLESICQLDTKTQIDLMQTGSPQERIWAAWAVGLKLCTPTVDNFIVLARDIESTPSKRRRLIRMLADRGERTLLEVLARHDPEQTIRLLACHYLIQSPVYDEQLQNLLLEILLYDNSSIVRYKIIKAAENGFPEIDSNDLLQIKIDTKYHYNIRRRGKTATEEYTKAQEWFRNWVWD